MKDMPFALKELAPTDIISALPSVKAEMICVEKIAMNSPVITQKIVDHIVDLLMASLSRSNFFAP